MLRIKLVPFGKKHAHTYRFAVVEARSKLTGSPSDYIGHYNPSQSKPVVDSEKLKKWLALGAQPTAAIRKLLGL